MRDFGLWGAPAIQYTFICPTWQAREGLFVSEVYFIRISKLFNLISDLINFTTSGNGFLQEFMDRSHFDVIKKQQYCEFYPSVLFDLEFNESYLEYWTFNL